MKLVDEPGGTGEDTKWGSAPHDSIGLSEWPLWATMTKAKALRYTALAIGNTAMNFRHVGCPTLAACATVLVLSMPGTPLWAQDDFRVEAGGTFLHGPVDGRVQTPAGGNLGSTSPGRPTFDELGIKSVDAADFWMNVSRGRHGLYAGGRIMRLSGGGTLDDTLISQNRLFAAGLPVDAEVQFDWYRVGYRYLFPWDWGDRTIELYPSIGAAILDFHYTLSSPGLDGVDRSYTKVGAQIGLGVTVPLTERLSLTGQVLAPIPFSHAPEILSAQAMLKYRFLERSNLSISGLVGLGYDRISYTDGQTVPNDIEADMGPMGMLGLEIRF
jgi:hypothetical protein